MEMIFYMYQQINLIVSENMLEEMKADLKSINWEQKNG